MEKREKREPRERVNGERNRNKIKGDSGREETTKVNQHNKLIDNQSTTI